jgi:hypothetical protein
VQAAAPIVVDIKMVAAPRSTNIPNDISSFLDECFSKKIALSPRMPMPFQQGIQSTCQLQIPT